MATIQKDNAKTDEEGLLEIYKRLSPGEPPTVESADLLLTVCFLIRKDMTWLRLEDINLIKNLQLQPE